MTGTPEEFDRLCEEARKKYPGCEECGATFGHFAACSQSGIEPPASRGRFNVTLYPEHGQEAEGYREDEDA